MPYTKKLRLHVLVVIVVSLGVSLPLPAGAAKTPYTAGSILFMGTRNGNGDLYVVRGATQTEQRIVSNPGHDCGPAMRPTPPGSPVRELVFASMRLNGTYQPGGYFKLYKLDVRTHKTRRLTFGSYHDGGPTWSPDGKRIAFSSTRNASPLAVGAPNWPVSGASIWIMSASGKHPRQITDAGAFETHSTPAWSPDGRWIVFTVTPKGDPLHPSTYAVRPNGVGKHIIQYDALYPAWSPNGARIVFSSARAGLPEEQDLYVMNADGSDVRRITHDAGAEFMPNWSSDGKHLTYVHDPDGWTDIAAVTLLPTGTTVDTYSSGPQESSIWAADLAVSHGTYRITQTFQRTKGGMDLFPRFAPSWL